MRSLSTLIIDDEKHARESLTALLELYCPGTSIVGTAAEAEQGIRLIREHQPEVVFLDIAIGESNGFQLLDQLIDPRFQLIFTTAYNEFALKAFRYQALDYLLKPIQPPLLQKAVTRAKRTLQSRQIGQQLDALTRSLQSEPPGNIMVPTQEGLNVIRIQSILHVSGSANYSTFYLEKGEKNHGLKKPETL